MSEETPKPFPFFPSTPSVEELTRTELMMELNKWANNDEYIAKQKAEILINVIKKQFSIE